MILSSHRMMLSFIDDSTNTVSTETTRKLVTGTVYIPNNQWQGVIVTSYQSE